MRDIVYYTASGPSAKPTPLCKIAKDEFDHKLNTNKDLADHHLRAGKATRIGRIRSDKEQFMHFGSPDKYSESKIFLRKYVFFRSFFVILTRGLKKFSPTNYW